MQSFKFMYMYLGKIITSGLIIVKFWWGTFDWHFFSFEKIYPLIFERYIEYSFATF